MTTDIELLPLPEADDSVENHAQWPIVIHSDVWLQKSVQDYARANIAPLIAEIEWLRAEIKSLQTLRDVVIENHGYWKARAERLAEVLQEYRYAPKFSHDHDAIKRTVELEDEIDDLLREQEDGRD